MCEQCIAKVLEYGEVLPEIFLCRATQNGYWMKKDDWGLVIMNDPFIIWEQFPISKNVDTDKAHKYYMNFIDNGYCRPLEGTKLVNAAKQVGYDETTNPVFESWLTEYIAQYVANTETPELITD